MVTSPEAAFDHGPDRPDRMNSRHPAHEGRDVCHVSWHTKGVVLVNFDDDRAARSIEALAQTCQIIYFTCHPTTPLNADKEETIRPLEVVG